MNGFTGRGRRQVFPRTRANVTKKPSRFQKCTYASESADAACRRHELVPVDCPLADFDSVARHTGPTASNASHAKQTAAICFC